MGVGISDSFSDEKVSAKSGELQLQSASRRASRRARVSRPRPTRSDLPPRGGRRFGLRPARLPPRDQHSIEEVNATDRQLPLSTAGHLKVGFHPWLNIRSARWLRIQSAPTEAHVRGTDQRQGPHGEPGCGALCGNRFARWLDRAAESASVYPIAALQLARVITTCKPSTRRCPC